MKSPARSGTRKAAPARRRVAKAQGAFHHGDLEWAILEAASQLLEAEGPLGVGLRAAARLAGVSHTAPYRHFQNRESILAALAVRGLDDLAGRIAESARRHDDPRAALAAIAEAYVSMAAERPHRFRLMFGPVLADKSRHPEVRAAGLRALQILQGVMAAGQEAGVVRAGDPADLALAHWAMLHGVASLLVDGLLAERASQRGGPAALARLADEHLRLGIEPRDPRPR